MDDLHLDLTSLIHKYSKTNDTKLLIFTLQVLNEYFSKTTVYNVSKSQNIVVEAISLISNTSSDKNTIYQLLGEFLTVS